MHTVHARYSLTPYRPTFSSKRLWLHYFTDKRAFRQTKLATLVLALAWYDTYLRAPSQPVFAGLTTV